MKTAVIFLFLFCFLNKCVSQRIEGEWNGYYTGLAGNFSEKKSIKILFSKMDTSTFIAYSVSYGLFNNDDSVVCILKGGFVNKKLYLEEKRIINQTDTVLLVKMQQGCLQIFELNFLKKKKQNQLIGNWFSSTGNCGQGHIYLFKNN